MTDSAPFNVDAKPSGTTAANGSIERSHDGQSIGIVIVDHGSRRDESNALLVRVADAFQASMGWAHVEPAHMELAEPSIATAIDRLVARGVRLLIVHPYFLAPGRHWHDDIPRLVADAAARHEGLQFLVTAPLGLHPLMMQIIQDRITHCLAHVQGNADPCEMCTSEHSCSTTARGDMLSDTSS